MNSAYHTMKFAIPICSIPICAISSMMASGQVTVDFAPSGELAAQFTIFSGDQYSESPAGGLDSSVGVVLAKLQVSTCDGNQSESLAANGFTNGSKFTVGAYFNMSSLGTTTAADGQILRLGLTNDGPDNFASLPFSTIEMTNTTTGEAKFVVRESLSSDTNTFTLSTAQWYYFETTFTRGANDDLAYDMVLANSDSSGVIGSVVQEYSHFQVTTVDVNVDQVNAVDLGQAIHGGFKGHATTAAGVLDNFYVSNTGLSQIPEPADFKIVSYSRDSGTGEATIVFSSESGADYTLLGGEDLTNLAPLISSIPGTGGDVPVNHTPAGDPPKFFHRVRRN